MNLKNFDKRIDKKVLARAKELFKSSAVEAIDESGGGEWEAVVVDGDSYTVTVVLQDDVEIELSKCNCDRNNGNVCSHQGAVFFSLKELLVGETVKKTGIKKPKKDALAESLLKTSHDTLMNAVLEYAKKDKVFNSFMSLKFAAKSTDILKSSQQLIRSTIKASINRGYVSKIKTALKGIEEVKKNIDDAVSNGDLVLATSLCILLWTEIDSYFEKLYSVPHELYDIIEYSIDKIDVIIDAVDDKNSLEAKEIFHMLLKHAFENRFEQNRQNEILRMLIVFCENEELRNVFESRINDAMLEFENWVFSINKIHFQLIISEMYLKVYGESKADAYMETNIDNPDFRRIIIQKSIKNNNCDKALQLCKEGINLYEKTAFSGLADNFYEDLFKVYVALGDIEKQKELATKFLLNRKYEYYSILKDLYSKDEWKNKVNQLLKEAPYPTTYSYRGTMSLYLYIIIEEEMLHLVLEYCKLHSNRIDEFGAMLVEKYPTEVEKIYRDVIFRLAKNATQRMAYREVCDYIKSYREDLKKDAKDIINKIISENKNKPAFLDELSLLGEV